MHSRTQDSGVWIMYTNLWLLPYHAERKINLPSTRQTDCLSENQADKIQHHAGVDQEKDFHGFG